MSIAPELLYGNAAGSSWPERHARLRERFIARFNRPPAVWVSAPGRTELGGNHTDHNRGRVLAAAVDLDAVAAASPNDAGSVRVSSAGYEHPFMLRLDDRGPDPAEVGTSTALLRGVIARLREVGCTTGGFDAVVESQVAPGSGLSSSAAFEVLIGTLISELFNRGSVPPGTIAAAGQYAENRYFGKPCGLMDQLASATGGALHIDFAEPSRPVTEQVRFDPSAGGYTLCVVQTGGSHADLTGEYASIPAEMKAVAACFGLPDCRDLTSAQLLAENRRVRDTAGDRAFLRAIHFLDENERVLGQVRALKAGDLAGFFRLVAGSGESSAMLLQNCWSAAVPGEQGVALALALTRDLLRRDGGGACRVHGGGFAGTIQAYIPMALMPDYIRLMETVFGAGCVLPLKVRPQGAVALDIPAPPSRP